MGAAIRVAVEVEPAGGWRVAVEDGDGRPRTGRVPALAVGRLGAELASATALGAKPPLRVAQRDRGDRAYGQALARVLRMAEPPVVDHLVAWLAGHADRSDPAVVVVDALDVSVRSLRWELLASAVDGPAYEADGRVVLARGHAGRPLDPWVGGGRLRTLLWCPLPDDPVCAARVATLAADPDVLWVSLDALPSPAPDVVDVLHVVCHGAALGSEVALLWGAEPGSADALAHAVSPLLDRVGLVVLEVCEGGRATSDELDSVASRLIRAGAAAVVASTDPLTVTAAGVFTAALSRALRRGAPLAGAVAAGRRALRGPNVARADRGSRWHTPTLLVAGLSVPGRRLRASAWTPSSWPALSAGTRGWLGAARSRAIAREQGFLGVEHLAVALLDRPQARGLLAWVRSGLLPGFEEESPVTSLVAGFSQRGARRAPALTAQLDAVVGALPPLAEPDLLMQALLAHPACLLHGVRPHLLSLSGHADALPPAAPRWPAGPAGVLAVASGPHAGLRLSLTPGEAIGRSSGLGDRAEVALYADTQVTDRRLRRRHLVWLGEGRVQVVGGPARHVMGDRTEAVVAGQSVTLAIGDVLMLTPSTWVAGVAGLAE
ncbi:MAG: hypothetical protein ACI8PZ_001326 [Myxococcota bacterium]|jgi:hypothetical protein